MMERRRVQQRAKDAKCSFCVSKVEPDYRQAKALGKYVTDRGKVIGRSRSGLCQKHQKRLVRAIKRARHLALMPFVGR